MIPVQKRAQQQANIGMEVNQGKRSKIRVFISSYFRFNKGVNKTKTCNYLCTLKMAFKRIKRSENYSEWYNNLVKDADLAEHSAVKGCMVIKPYGYAIWEKMQAILDKKFKDTGHSNAYFPLFIPKSYFPRNFTKHTDNRGAFVEIMRAGVSGQFSYSTTVPGITRGNHFHTRKVERFAVIKGKASIKLRKVDSDEVIEYLLNGDKPSYVDMPIWNTHNITNIGEEELVTLFWINEPYNPDDADTYFVEV